jgi:hypothetical protein
MIEATEETPCHEWCNQLRDTIDTLTAERDRYREIISNEMPWLLAALNPPKEPT